MTQPMTTNLPTIPARRTVFVSGIPSFRAYYVVYLASEILRRLVGDITTMSFNDTSDATLKKLRNLVPARLLYLDLPERAAVEMVSKSDAPVLFVHEEISKAARQFMKTRGCDATSAAITMSRCYAAIAELQRLPRAVTIPFDKFETALELARYIADALGVSTAQWLGICDAFCVECHLDRPVANAVEEFSANAITCYDEPIGDELSMLDQLSTAYSFEPCGNLFRLRVPRAMILEANAPHRPAMQEIDLTGPARCLTFGPYLSLPAGRWGAHFEFEMRDNRSTNSFEFDIAANGVLVRRDRFTVRSSGRFALTVPFKVAEGTQSLEFRTHLTVGAIYGRFKLTSIVIEKRDGHDGEPQLAITA